MAWPPQIPPNTRTNTTVQQDNHPDDHVAIANALTEVVGRMRVQYLATREGLGEIGSNTGVDYPFAPGVVKRDSGDITKSGGVTYQFSPVLNQPMFVMLSGGIRWGVNGNGFRRASIAVNDDTVVEQHGPAFSSGFTTLNVATAVKLNPGDTFRLIAWQNGGGVGIAGGSQCFISVAGLG